MTDLTGSATWQAVVPIPDNGEDIMASSATSPPPTGEGPIEPALSALTDRTTYLKDRSDKTLGGTLSVKGMRFNGTAGGGVSALNGSIQVSKVTQDAPAGSAPKTTGTDAGELTLGLCPRARGRINPDGTIKRGINIYDCAKTGTGVYVVELTWAPAHVDNFDVTLGSWESNPGAINYSGCVWYSPTIANGRISFTVESYVNNSANDQGFSFVAWGE